MYAEFAQVYDRLMGDFDYACWARFYESLLSRAGIAPGALCECACGTGSMAVELSRLGWRVTGVDSSPEMLEIAQAKARAAGLQISFARQDMRRLALHRPVSAVVCPCDGVNYLLTEKDLGLFFEAAFAALSPGGALAFDVSSADKLKRQAQARFFGEDLDELTYLWQNRYDETAHTVEMELCFFLRRPDGLYARFDERQTQRAHEVPELLRALERAGFVGVECFGDGALTPPRPDERRIHLLARKG